ncbi:MAG: 50S ribosomal protein L15 [Chitinophagales bacterium]|nr:50S ribosomal protein L15 [Chitinophagales bacterium]
MDLSNLKPAKGSVKGRKRIGRGQGSGRGGTSTRGHKGAKSRAGYSQKRGHEGGQMPLQRRVPKRGFKNPFRVEYRTINLDQLQLMSEKYEITKFDTEMFEANNVSKAGQLLKILGRGELKSKIEIWAHAYSETAKAAIEALGGTANVIE